MDRFTIRVIHKYTECVCKLRL